MARMLVGLRGPGSVVSTQITSGEAWSFRKKAHCNNSSGSTYFATCDYTWYVGHSCV